MMKKALLLLAVLTSLRLHAEETTTWQLADGRAVEGSLRGALPGVILITGKDGKDERVPVSKLSAESKKRIVELLGLSVSEASPAPSASPALPPPSAPMAEAAKAPVATASRDPGAMDATDLNLIASRLGMKSVVIGVVKSVLTLGSTGHKKLLFEGSEFEVFLSKSVQEKEPAQDLEALKGQTVQITGTISQYQEKLQISLRSVSDLAVVSGN